MARAYLELFAGGASIALALMGGPRVVPPVGYMGGKRKLAPTILSAVGLRPGQGAERGMGARVLVLVEDRQCHDGRSRLRRPPL